MSEFSGVARCVGEAREEDEVAWYVKKVVCRTLGKRISTATPIQHEMWLISLENLLMLYGEKGYGRVMEVHQELKRRHLLTRWRERKVVPRLCLFLMSG